MIIFASGIVHPKYLVDVIRVLVQYCIISFTTFDKNTTGCGH